MTSGKNECHGLAYLVSVGDRIHESAEPREVSWSCVNNA